jgi:hypothetical protein
MVQTNTGWKQSGRDLWSSDVQRQPPFDGGLSGGLAVIGEKLSYLKQSVRVEIRWLHGPPIFQFTRQRSSEFEIIASILMRKHIWDRPTEIDQLPPLQGTDVDTSVTFTGSK